MSGLSSERLADDITILAYNVTLAIIPLIKEKKFVEAAKFLTDAFNPTLAAKCENDIIVSIPAFVRMVFNTHENENTLIVNVGINTLSITKNLVTMGDIDCASSAIQERLSQDTTNGLSPGDLRHIFETQCHIWS